MTMEFSSIFAYNRNIKRKVGPTAEKIHDTQHGEEKVKCELKRKEKAQWGKIIN